jgi:VPDSG-CTERM motif
MKKTSIIGCVVLATTMNCFAPIIHLPDVSSTAPLLFMGLAALAFFRRRK